MNDAIPTYKPEIPRHQFASLMPVPVSDYMHYQFYEICPPSCMYVAYPMIVRSFDAESAEETVLKLPKAIDFLNKRKVDRITFAGLPIAGALGRDRCLEIAESVRDQTNIPFSFDAEESVEALKALGARSIVVGAKWPRDVMDRISRYMKAAGFEVLGYSSDHFTASQVIGVTPESGSQLARDLGRAALDAYPKADALLLGGGAWLNLPAIGELEAKYNKPVVSNTVASSWSALRQMNLQARATGLGRLIDGLGTPSA